MAASATIDTSEKLIGAIGELQKMGANLKEAVDNLNTPQYKAHAGDGTLGLWEGVETVTVTPAKNQDGSPREWKSKVRMPKGYKNNFKSFSQFLREGYRAHESKACGDFNSRYEDCYKAVQGMSLQEGASMGYMVMPEFNQQIIDRMYDNDIWSRTDQYVVNNNMVFMVNAETSRANGSRHGGLRGYWLDEATSLTKSKPTLRKVDLSLKKLAVLVYLTEELIADGGPAVEQYVSRKAADEFQFMLGDSVFNGNGAGQPLGILNSPGLLSITKEAGQAAATIVTENIDKMWARRYTSGNYSWYHNQDCGPQVERLSQDIGTSGVVLNRPNGIYGASTQTLKGAPRVETEFNATLGTTGDLILADLSKFITINKGGINQAYSTHVEFLTDQLAIKFTLRVNGKSPETSPTTPYKGSNTQASFITVETRS